MSWSSGLNATNAKLDAVLDQVGLTGRGQDLVAGYSLGMKQRLGIAAALVHGPELLFLDEPTNGLDPSGTQEIRQLITDLAAEGTTIFLSSHILHEVEAVCNEVMILHHMARCACRGGSLSCCRLATAFICEISSAAQAQRLLQRAGVQSTLLADGLELSCAEVQKLPQLIRRLVSANLELYRVESRTVLRSCSYSGPLKPRRSHGLAVAAACRAAQAACFQAICADGCDLDRWHHRLAGVLCIDADLCWSGPLCIERAGVAEQCPRCHRCGRCSGGALIGADILLGAGVEIQP